MAKKQQFSFRVNDDLAKRVIRVADKLAQSPMGIAVNDGESTAAAALRYILVKGLPGVEEELGIVGAAPSGDPPPQSHLLNAGTGQLDGMGPPKAPEAVIIPPGSQG